MRSALGTAAPAFFISFFIIQPLKPLLVLGRGRCVRLGDQHVAVRQHVSQRGWSARARTRSRSCPDATFGLAPAGQPRAVAISTVGISDFFGAGSSASDPCPIRPAGRPFQRQALTASVSPKER